jgi:hypothetical protein
VVLEGFSMKMRALMGLVLRRVRRRTAHVAGGFSFELMLAPSREEPGRYAIKSVREIDRRTARKALRAFGLVGIPSLVPFRSSVGGRAGGGAGEAGYSGPRITFVRLTPRQALRMFGEIRRRDPDVRKLYAHLQAKDLKLIRSEARGAVMRAYAADGTARGEGAVIELPHGRADGTEASFHVSIKHRMAGEGGSGEVRADYEIGRGEEVETYKIEDGRTFLAGRRRLSL